MIAIASDHGGYELKVELIKHLKEKGLEVIDAGCDSEKSCDYPEYAKKVASLVLEKKAQAGILLCGTGIGMSIAANKIKGIRAALVSDCFSAKATRQHNDTNILCMGARVIGKELAFMIADIFLDTEFSNEERHLRRIKQIESC